MSSFEPQLPKPQPEQQQQQQDESFKPQSKKATKKEAVKLEKLKRRWEAAVATDIAFDGGSACQQLRRHSNFGLLVEGCSLYQGLDQNQQAG